MKGLLRLTYFAILLAAVVVSLGAYTRLTEAGLGCPDWPGCYGFLSVPTSEAQRAVANEAFPHAPLEAEKAWNEMIHRYVAGTLGLIILAMTVFAWRVPSAPKLHALGLLAVVVFQAVLGMWTVTMNLLPVVVMGHLAGGFTVLSLLVLFALRLQSRLSNKGKKPPTSVNESGKSTVMPLASSTSSFSSLSLQPWLVLALLCVIVQILLGGWTSANYAAVVCTQLPFCEVDWLSSYNVGAFNPLQGDHDSYQYGVLNYTDRVSIHVTHRLGALVTAFVVLLMVVKVWQQQELRSLLLWCVVLLMAQITLGVLNVVLSLPLGVALAHHFIAACLLQALIITNYRYALLKTSTRSDASLLSRRTYG